MIYKSYELQKNLTNILKNKMLLLYGENFGLKEEIKGMVINKKKQTNKNTEIHSLYENDIIENEKIFLESVYSGSLFSSEKVITINNCSEKIIKKLENIVEDYPENLLIILLSNVLEKKSKLRNYFEVGSNYACIPCYLDTSRDLENIIIKNFRENKISLSKEMLNLLVEKSNNDRGNLINEIEKIKNYSLNKKKISIEEIKYLINFTGEYKSDALINECLCGNNLGYKKILEELYINTVNQIFLLRILSNKIEKLLKMKEMEKNYNNIESLINASKPPIFWKEKPIIKKQLKTWNLIDLKKIFSEINNTEIMCKKNPALSKIIFFNFFNEICKKANNYS